MGKHDVVNLFLSWDQGMMLWCCAECERWAEDDGYAARAVVTDMRSAAIAIQVQLHRRLWPGCGAWQRVGSGCPAHAPEVRTSCKT